MYDQVIARLIDVLTTATKDGVDLFLTESFLCFDLGLRNNNEGEDESEYKDEKSKSFHGFPLIFGLEELLSRGP